MVSFKLNVSNYEDAERMAAAYLAAYFDNTEIIYPLSPFKMLKDEGIDFVIRNFNKLEGVYIPAQLNNPGGNPSPVRRMEITNPFYWKSRFR